MHTQGWVGPAIKQFGHYPPAMHPPSTPAEYQQKAGKRFNSELALFLLVAEDHMYWMYRFVVQRGTL